MAKQTIHDLNDPATLRSLDIPVPRKSGDYPANAKNERELQSQCELWLSRRDYRRMTAKNAVKGGTCRGWFGHWVENRKNPLISDIVIFKGQRSLLIEIKHPPIRWKDGQEAMVCCGAWKLATSLDEFTAIVQEWEAKE